MQATEKIKAAVKIFKTELSGAKGKFRAALSDTNSNVVEFFNEIGLYCSINVKSGMIKDI